MYEKYLDSEKKSLCIFTKYSENGPSSKYRIMIFENDLRKNFAVKEFRFWNEQYYAKYSSNKRKYVLHIAGQYILNSIKRLYQLLFIAPHYDIVFFQKCCIPWCKWNDIKYLKKNGCKVIFDVDDAVYMNDKDGTSRIARDSDIVIVGNETLASYYQSYNSNIVIAPTVDYSPAYDYFRHDTFFDKVLIWVGSAASVENLDLLVEPINTLVKRHPEVTFRYICDSDHGYTKRILNSQFIKWDKDSFIKDMSVASVGLMPLKENEFNRGKCGFKLIQYLNLGKPVVASNVGVNSEIVDDCGFVVDNEQDFVNALERLLYDESIYRMCESNISTKFMPRYGYTKALDALQAILNFQGE